MTVLAWPCKDKKIPLPNLEEERGWKHDIHLKWGRKWFFPLPYFSFDYKKCSSLSFQGMAPSCPLTYKPHKPPIVINTFFSITLSLAECFLSGDIKDWRSLEPLKHCLVVSVSRPLHPLCRPPTTNPGPLPYTDSWCSNHWATLLTSKNQRNSWLCPGILLFKVTHRDFHGGPMAKALCAQCRGLGSIPGQGTRSHMSQRWVHMLQLKTPHSAIKTWYSQINNF